MSPLSFSPISILNTLSCLCGSPERGIEVVLSQDSTPASPRLGEWARASWGGEAVQMTDRTQSSPQRGPLTSSSSGVSKVQPHTPARQTTPVHSQSTQPRHLDDLSNSPPLSLKTRRPNHPKARRPPIPGSHVSCPPIYQHCSYRAPRP